VNLTLLQNKFFKKTSGEDFSAVNIGSHYIKGLNVEGGEIVSYFIENNNNLPATIKKLSLERKISKKNVKISIKNPSCLVRYFPFPKMDKKKLNQALFYEMNKFIPFSPDEVYFDFAVLKETSHSELFILLAVVKKKSIDQILSIFSKVNIKISEISLDSVCLINLFLHAYEEATKINACILDIGHEFSTMTILSKGVPFLTRDVKFSTKDIFEVVSRVSNISADKVQEWVKSSENSDEFSKLIQDSASGVCLEMRSSFDYFEVNRGEHIDKVYLTGGLSSLESAVSSFAEFLDIPAEAIEVISRNKIKLGKDIPFEELKRLQNNFSVGFGLTL